MAEVATVGAEKSLDDFFAKRDKKKKKEKGKGKETVPVSAPVSLKKTKKEKEKSMKNENPDATVEKVTLAKYLDKLTPVAARANASRLIELLAIAS